MANIINIPQMQHPSGGGLGKQLIATGLTSLLESVKAQNAADAKEKTEATKNEAAYSGLDEWLNPAQPSPALETKNMQEKIEKVSAPTAGQPTALTELMRPKNATRMPAPNTLEDLVIPPPTGEVAGSRVTDTMPTAPMAVDDPKRTPIPKGLSAETYGAMAKNTMAMRNKPQGSQYMVDTEGNVIGIPKGQVGETGFNLGQKPKGDYATFKSGFLADFPEATESDASRAYGDEVARRKAKGYEGLLGGRTVSTIDPETGEPVAMTAREATAGPVAQRPRLATGNPKLKQSLAEAAMRGGATSANINAANELYQKNYPELLALRSKLYEKGKVFEKLDQLKTYQELKQWVQTEISDPEMALMAGKSLLTAEALSRTLGGTQGGQWQFEVAKQLLDTRLAPDAYEARLVGHALDLSSLAEARRNFGRTPVTQPGGVPNNAVVPQTPVAKKPPVDDDGFQFAF